jgi:peptide/nickel transport system permease protein
MARVIAGRLVQALITLWLLSFVVFVLGRVSGDPVANLVPVESTTRERAELAHELGLDKPVLQQYWGYLKDLAHGDFGVSLRFKRPVSALVVEPLLNSLRLAAVALVLSSLIGITMGILAATNRGGWWDRLAMAFALLGQSLPSFAIGMVLILVFAVGLKWLPASGTGGPAHYVLPAITVGWVSAASVARLLRSSMLEVLDSEFVKLARAKGVSETGVVWKHALRNALIPVVTIIALTFGALIAGALTAEVVFTWPGLGRLAYQAVLARDFPLVQFCVLIFGAMIIGLNLVVDISYVFLDPRVRL